jgi:outer membrane protein TolC
LKDFGIETGTSQIRIANISVDASENQFRNRVDDIILQVVNNYWELVYQIAQIKAIEDALGLAEDLLRETEIRIEVGTLAPIEVYQARAEVAQRKEALIVAKDTLKDIEDQLRLSLNLYDKEEYWMVTIVPADQPLSPPVEPDLTESIRTALERRPDLLQAKLDIDARNINVKYTKNQTLPTVDLFGSVGTTGLRGRPADSQFFGVDARPSPWQGHWDNVADDLFNGDFYNYTIGIKIEFPWENRFAKSAYSRAKVEKARSLTALKDLEINIITQVKEAVRQLATDLERIEAAKATLRFTREKLDAEKKKYDVGLSTSHDVLEFQEDLARSQADFARTLSNYEESLANHARVKGVLLEAAGLRM